MCVMWTVSFVAVVFSVVKVVQKWKEFQWERNKPPLYGEYHRAELAQPHHDVVNAFSRGKKYLWVNNHVSGEWQTYRTLVRQQHLSKKASDGETI